MEAAGKVKLRLSCMAGYAAEEGMKSTVARYSSGFHTEAAGWGRPMWARTR
jgi:hypothetical protein